jgi:hypothetical protein
MDVEIELAEFDIQLSTVETVYSGCWELSTAFFSPFFALDHLHQG